MSEEVKDNGKVREPARIVRATTPAAVDLVASVGLLVDDPDCSREMLIDRIKECLIRDPEGIYFLVAHNGGEVVGQLIGIRDPEAGHIFIWQTKCLPGVGKLPGEMFAKLIMWGHARGLTKIKLETTLISRVKALQRRWGFRVESVVMAFDIPEDLAESVLRISKDGQLDIERNEDGCSTQEPSTVPSVRSHAGELLISPEYDAGRATDAYPKGSAKRGNSLHGELSSSVGPSVRGIEGEAG